MPGLTLKDDVKAPATTQQVQIENPEVKKDQLRMS